MKIIAKINDCSQYSEDGWESIQHLKEVSEETTIKDLIEWQKSKFKSTKGVQEGFFMRQITICNFE